ncbi:MAG: thiol peroxidase [Candidatus Auribacterota bacterium]|nr:thiol peroxidase [Candidatus Auribacterota bacterium]
MERTGFTVKGNPITLLGEEIRTGQQAPSFTVLNTDLEPVSFEKFANKIKVIAAVPSLDTPVCETQIVRFNNEATQLSKDVVILFISMDLPFAIKRAVCSNDIKKVKALSDHRDADFGKKYGVLIKELRLLARSVFLVDQNNTVQYVEYVKELSSPPNYEAVLNAIKKLI